MILLKGLAMIFVGQENPLIIFQKQCSILGVLHSQMHVEFALCM